MKCQICKEHDANVHFKQVVNGESQELFICEQCAAENGFDVHSPMSMTDFLFGMGSDKKSSSEPELDCPVCRMHFSEFRKSSRLGCPACYDAFNEQLAGHLAAMHKGISHVGKAPERERITVQVIALQKALDAAVERQDFEEAAALRDKITGLREDRNAAEKAAGSAVL